MEADSLVLSHQLCDQGGVSQQGIPEAGQQMLLAYQLGAKKDKYSIPTKSQVFQTQTTVIPDCYYHVCILYTIQN